MMKYRYRVVEQLAQDHNQWHCWDSSLGRLMPQIDLNHCAALSARSCAKCFIYIDKLI